MVQPKARLLLLGSCFPPEPPSVLHCRPAFPLRAKWGGGAHQAAMSVRVMVALPMVGKEGEGAHTGPVSGAQSDRLASSEGFLAGLGAGKEKPPARKVLGLQGASGAPLPETGLLGRKFRNRRVCPVCVLSPGSGPRGSREAAVTPALPHERGCRLPVGQAASHCGYWYMHGCRRPLAELWGPEHSAPVTNPADYWHGERQFCKHAKY